MARKVCIRSLPNGQFTLIPASVQYLSGQVTMPVGNPQFVVLHTECFGLRDNEPYQTEHVVEPLRSASMHIHDTAAARYFACFVDKDPLLKLPPHKYRQAFTPAHSDSYRNMIWIAKLDRQTNQLSDCTMHDVHIIHKYLAQFSKRFDIVF